MDNKKFTELAGKLYNLLFTATSLERDPGESLDDDFIAVQLIYPKILNAYNGNEISIGQRNALVALYHECMEIYLAELER